MGWQSHRRAWRKTLGAKQCQRNHTSAITSAVGLNPRGDHDGIKEIISNLLVEPFEVPHMRVTHSCRELDLNGENLAVASNDEKVHLLRY